MKKRVSTKKGVTKKKTVGWRFPPNKRSMVAKFPRNMPLLAPARMMVKLQYADIDSEYIVGGGALVYASLYYKGNSAYDVNGAVGSTSMPGFSNWASIYYKYRVHQTKVEVTFQNTDGTNPIYCGLLPYGPGLSQPASWGHWLQSKSQPYARQKLCAPVGSGDSNQKCQTTIPWGTFFGDEGEYIRDQNNAAVTTASPINVFSVALYVTDFDGTTILPNKIPVRGTVTMWCEFYERKVVYL